MGPTRLHGAVHAVGHRALSQHGRWMAAVLRGGENAVLRGAAAAALWGIAKAVSGPTAVHRLLLAPDEITTKDGIPVATVPRTLLDLSRAKDPRLERILREADVQRLLDWTELESLVRRNTRTPGTAALRRLLEATRAKTRSELEDLFNAMLATHGLPEPEWNVRVRTVEVDCLWRRQQVIVELDGHQAHGTRAAFERDRERDRKLAAAGFVVIRITWRQLREDPATVARDLRKLVA